ncbi:motile sperm domain-containing protein 2-like [Brevipalpus obovatus]|uniref:motile sperm domain-containing protein 2-like n=1 Tax=Brevipalpus obovatus TaxID=246614 RepID=UPI003D9E9B3E
MTIMTTVKRTDRSAANVKNLRQRFKQVYLAEKESFYEADYDKLMSDDWYVKRFFLARNRNEDEAFKMIVDAMRWRKSIKVRDIKDYTFPREFYAIGGLFVYEPDKNGYPTVYIRVKMHRKIPELEEMSRQFLIHTLNKADLIAQGNGIAIVFDVSGAGYKNLDMDNLKFLISCGTSYFPVGVKYILILNVPWAFNAFRRMALSFLPEQWFGLLRFASGDEVYKYIDRENLPDYLNGTCIRNYYACPQHSPSLSEVVTDYGYTQSDIDRILPQYTDFLQEAAKALAKSKYKDPDAHFFDQKETIPAKEEKEKEVRKEHELESFTRLLDIVPNSVITYDPLDQAYVASLLIYNPNSRPVAFKVQSTNPKNYAVSHPFGIVLATSILVVKIRFNDKNEPSKRDRFKVIGLLVEDDQMKRGKFNQIWIDRKEHIKSFKFSLGFSGTVELSKVNDAYHSPRGNSNNLSNGDVKLPSTRTNGHVHFSNDSSLLVNRIYDITHKMDQLAIQHKKLWLVVFMLLIVCLSMISYSFVSGFSKESFHCLQDSPIRFSDSLR